MYNEIPSFTIKIKSANELCAKKKKNFYRFLSNFEKQQQLFHCV